VFPKRHTSFKKLKRSWIKYNIILLVNITPSLSIFIAEARRPRNNVPLLSSSSCLLLLCTPPGSHQSSHLYRLPNPHHLCGLPLHLAPSKRPSKISHNAYILIIIMATHAYVWNAIIFCCRSLFYRMPSSEVTERNSTKLCHMFWSEPDLKIVV